MPSILQNFEYDIFISYRHNDNRSGWVTEFVKALQEELAATIKEPVSVYFDSNPHDGLLETHNVDKSLEGKLKCLIFIPILSQTYCDPKSFAWQHEFVVFNKLAKEDQFGRDIKLSNGNVASRILPIKIHDLDVEDKATIEYEIGGALRTVEFIYKTAGVNRPLAPSDNPEKSINKTFYRDQINKVANGVKEILVGLKNFNNPVVTSSNTLTHASLSTSAGPAYKKIFNTISVGTGIVLVGIYLAFNFVETLHLSNREQRPFHKIILPIFILAIVTLVARMPARRMGYTLLQIVAVFVFGGGLMDLIFTFSSTSLPNGHMNYLEVGAGQVSNNLVRLDFALLRTLGTALMAVGIGSWVLLETSIKQGSKSAMIGLVIMITLTEGNNSLQMYSLGLEFYIYTITLVIMTWAGALIWWRGDLASTVITG